MDTITVDNSTGTDVVYSEVSSSRLGERLFTVVADANDAKRSMVFSNTYRAKPDIGVDRRRIHISKLVTDTASGVIHKVSLTSELVLPPTAQLSLAMVQDLVSAMIAVLGRNSSGAVDYGNVQAIMTGVVPVGDLAA